VPREAAGGELPPVSVVVCARDEAPRLERSLPLLLAQRGLDYELVVVDDGSADGTWELLEAWAARDPRLRPIRLLGGQGKKRAATLGIRACRHPRMVFTDADCLPASERWLAGMASGFAQGAELVLGVGLHLPAPGWQNALYRAETRFIALQYLAFAQAGMPYMGVGRNMAYTRGLFERQRGFERHLDLPSGDDDLFVSALPKGTPLALRVAPEWFTFSEAKNSWRAWWIQKRRHLSTSHRYTFAQKALLGGELASRFLFWCLLPWAGFCGTAFAGVLAAARLSSQILIFRLAAKRWGTRPEAWAALAFDLLAPFFYAATTLANWTCPTRKTWK